MCDTGPFGKEKDLAFLKACQGIGGVQTYTCKDSKAQTVSDAIQEIIKGVPGRG
jgi:hypothetical protein